MAALTVGFPHRAAPVGGPGSFQTRLMAGLAERGIDIVFADGGRTPDVIVIVGGTARLAWLVAAKARGARVVHRLDGINWRYRVLPVTRRRKVVDGLRNRQMAFIRRHLADHVIYQSEFVRGWWNHEYGDSGKPESVIYNAVDLDRFRPRGSRSLPPVLLSVEGKIPANPASWHVYTTVPRVLYETGRIREARFCGAMPDNLRERLEGEPGVRLLGPRARSAMPDVYGGGDVFLSAELNAACPNAVVEALATGLPVVGYDTGALAELVPPAAGAVVPFDSDPWKLEVPDTAPLIAGIERVLDDLDSYAAAARATAEERFGLEHMTRAYVDIFNRAEA